nr:unnamed protein product [Digitaria exilis]
MFRAGGGSSLKLKPAAGRCGGMMAVHSSLHGAAGQAHPSAPPNAIKGNFRPVNEIGEAALLDNLDGEVPEDFPEGVYIRNGPNPLHPTQTIADSIFGSTSYMYYEGHGMLHAVYFNKSSTGEWKITYRNKYVDSDTFQLEREKNEVAFVPSADGEPYGTLVAFLINIKIHGSGDLVIMGTNTEKPHFVLGVISSDGERLLHKVDLKFEEGKLIHDVGVTAKYNIIMDYPLRFGISRVFLQKPFIENDMNGKSRIGVMPRFGDAESIRWFDVENHCSYHLFNCFEDGDEVIVRGCRLLGSIIPSGRHRVDKSKWLNLESGETNEGYITSEEVAMDFPVINEKFIGIRHKYGYAQVADSLATSKTGLFKFNMIAKLNFDMPDKVSNYNESGVDEDDGWVVTYVHDERTNISQVYIIDAKRFSEEPVATITLPQRVPYGFHGNFFYK